MLISRLWAVGLSHTHGFLEYQIRGINIVVGTKIFSIVEDLGFVRSRFRSYLRF